MLPLRRDTAAELKRFFTGKLPQVKAFGGRYKRLTDKTAKMLRADLEKAGISYVADGFFFDFHAQRHQTGTLLAAKWERRFILAWQAHIGLKSMFRGTCHRIV